MIYVILINPTEATIKVIEIEENSISSIANILGEVPENWANNPDYFYYNHNMGDILCYNKNNRPENIDYFEIRDLEFNNHGWEISGNAVLVNFKEKDGKWIYTDTSLSIVDLMGKIKFYQHDK